MSESSGDLTKAQEETGGHLKESQTDSYTLLISGSQFGLVGRFCRSTRGEQFFMVMRTLQAHWPICLSGGTEL